MASKPYKPTRKVYDLVFESFPGMEVFASGISTGVLLDTAKMAPDIHKMTTKQQTEIFTLLAQNLVTWNLVHPDLPTGLTVCPRCGLEADMPLPTTLDGMLCLDMDILTAIIWGWVGAMARVALPKEMNILNGNNEMMLEMIKKLGELQNQ